MRRLLVIALVAIAAAGTAASAAPDRQTARKACSNRWSSMSGSERGDTRRQDFIAKCLKGAPAVPAMTAKPDEAGSMAKPVPTPEDGGGQP
jgi:type II secretory pathway pseudopilin PulG